MSQWLPGPRPNVRAVPASRAVRFRDINTDYGMTPGPLLVEEDVAIRKQIRNLLGTPIGSDDLEPLYGSNVPYRLYEQIRPEIGAYLIEVDTVIALRTWMRGIITLVNPGIRIYEAEGADGYLVNLPYQRVSDGGANNFNFELLR